MKKKKIVKTKRDANETAALVWTMTLNVCYKLEIVNQVAAQWLTYATGIRTEVLKKPPNIKTSETRDNANQVAVQWLTYLTAIITERATSYKTRTNASQIAAQWLTHSAGVKTEWIRLGTNNSKVS